MTIRALLLIPAAVFALTACAPDTDDSPGSSATDGAAGADAGASSSGASSSGASSSGASSSGASSSGASSSGASSSGGAAIEPEPSAEQKAFSTKRAKVLKAASAMSKEELLGKYKPKDSPGPAGKLGYDPLKADYMSLIDSKLKLNAAEKKMLAKNGFVVAERLGKPTMAEALLHVFKEDLPILVTTDMILQALHSSYDDILKGLEREVLMATIDKALAKAHAQIPKSAGTGDLDEVRGYGDFFIAVARSLLAGKPVPTNTGAVLDDEVSNFLGHIDGLQLKTVTIFGTSRKMDFSQFKPRGHYAGDAKLERYFRAMMWLGRADLRFLEFNIATNTWTYHPRQLATAVLLHRATKDGQAMALWQQANDLITLMVGPVDYIDFSGIAKLAKDHGIDDASKVLGQSQAGVDKMKAQLVAGQYGSQKIASHYLETNPYSAEVTPLPPSFAFLGQRFVVDSHVFSNVVYDRIVHNGKKVQRVLPNALDAMFVLGNDHALTLLAAELAKFPYQGALHTLRFLVDSYAEPFWDDNLYNLWLSALRTLNKPTTGKAFPTAMKSTAWADKTTRTQLASWAQLRHDTLLYAKQSYTGGVACEHPDGFVEPYPEFYAKLSHMADVAGQALVNAPFENKWFKDHLSKFFKNWRNHMDMLEAIAKKELAHETLSDADVKFLKETISANPGCGDPVFSGWYKSLYFNPENMDQFKPTIADVHTNPNSGPLPGPNVLHVATSDVNLMVFTSDTCGSPEAFVGPVYRYHEVDPKAIKRYSDQDWEKMLKDGSAPGQPAWTSSFMVPK